MSDLVEKVARAIDVPSTSADWRDYLPEARAAIAVVLKEQLEWVSDKAYENCEQGSDLWDWKALLDAAIGEYARENGIEL